MSIVKTPAQYQVIAAQIASKLHQDPDFRKKVLTDPQKTLETGYGIGVDAIRELVLEDAWLRDRYGVGTNQECAVTCVCSGGCCVTCWAGTSAGQSIDVARPEFGLLDPAHPALPVRDNLLRNLIERGHIRTPQSPN